MSNTVTFEITAYGGGGDLAPKGKLAAYATACLQACTHRPMRTSRKYGETERQAVERSVRRRVGTGDYDVVVFLPGDASNDAVIDRPFVLAEVLR